MDSRFAVRHNQAITGMTNKNYHNMNNRPILVSLCLFVITACAGIISAHEMTNHAITQSPPGKRIVECLDRDLARKAIVDESIEPYFSNLQRREITALMGQRLPSDWTLDQCREKIKRHFQETTLDFTKEEKQALSKVAEKIDALLIENFPLFVRQPWRFVKMKDSHCSGLAYTRADCIILNKRHISRICQAEQNKDETFVLRRGALLLVHEKIHVLQRFYPERFEPLYTKTWGFIRGRVEPNPWLTEHQVSNPDALDTDWIVTCTTDGGKQQFLWMLTLLKRGRDVPRLGRDFESVAVHLEKKQDHYHVVCDPSGKPVYKPMSSYPEYAKRFCPSARRGLDHPHEIAAYVFADLFLNEYVLKKPLSEDPDEKAFWNAFRDWSHTHLD